MGLGAGDSLGCLYTFYMYTLLVHAHGCLPSLCLYAWVGILCLTFPLPVDGWVGGWGHLPAYLGVGDDSSLETFKQPNGNISS